MYYLGPQIPFLVMYKLNEYKSNIMVCFNCYLGISLNLVCNVQTCIRRLTYLTSLYVSALS